MQINFTEDANRELHSFVKSGNKPVVKRITELIKAINETPFEGIGKPEPLKHSLAGLWSRRITKEHRLIYEVKGDVLLIHSVKGHY